MTTGFSHFPTQFHLTGMQHDAWLATEKQANFCDFLLTPQNHNLTFPQTRTNCTAFEMGRVIRNQRKGRGSVFSKEF